MSGNCVIIPLDDTLELQERFLYNDPRESIAQIVMHTHGQDNDPLNVISTILVRQPVRVYLHHYPQAQAGPNVRATRFAMACGHFAIRLKGTVVLTLESVPGVIDRLPLSSVIAATQTCDLRPQFIGHDVTALPEWLLGACRNTYHDAAALKRLAVAMLSEASSDSESEPEETSVIITGDHNENEAEGSNLTTATMPLCLWCRRPTSRLCALCLGVYFCSPDCEARGAYTERRTILSETGLGEWAFLLTSRPFQLFEDQYVSFLSGHISVTDGWWNTELSGWEGGTSTSAATVNISHRRSFQEGFYPLTDIPAEAPLSIGERLRLPQNSLGFARLLSWVDYYNIRKLSIDSPAALLLTFPLTLYYAIVEFGEIPCTVARLLGRALRIHLIGAEKELNFLDIFKEVCFLLPNDFSIELVVVTRKDMLPPTLRSHRNNHTFHLVDNLIVKIACGTYGTESLDPHFDCGSGPPDMIMAFNAGLFAYESWRSVVSYLDEHRGVVGVFTDYNEYSGVQCASLGGPLCRNSLQMNPFRQPRAMPVFSMNLPQMSNGFIYVFNQQDMDN